MSKSKTDNAKYFIRGCSIAIVLYLLACMIIALAGCSFTRDLQKNESTIQEKNTSDSVYVSKDKEDKSSLENWERMIERFAEPPKLNVGGDTNVFITQNYPIERIYERGSKQENSSKESYDSGAHKRINELEEKLKTKESSTETKVLTFWHLIGVALVTLILSLLLGKLKIARKLGK